MCHSASSPKTTPTCHVASRARGPESRGAACAENSLSVHLSAQNTHPNKKKKKRQCACALRVCSRARKQERCEVQMKASFRGRNNE